MTTQENERKPHSAEYFGEYRDFWWNSDFLELMAKRLQLVQVQLALDVGCGIGHWGQLLAPHLAPAARVIGVDREAEWVTKASARAMKFGLDDRYRYQQGDAMSLPFPDGQFDLVTCQTVLIHLRDPKAALCEMLRVLKPGGLILAAEPNNLANWSMQNSLSEELTVDQAMARLRFAMLIERGKRALGLGYNSIGDLIPGYLTELGASDLSVYLSDRAVPLLPPYSLPEQQANIQQNREWSRRRFIGWDRSEALGYFVAGGGSEAEFQHCFELLLREGELMIAAVDGGRFHSGGGGVTYLIAGRRARM